MEFRDLAAKETSALIARLTAGSGDSSRQRLRAFRGAIEGATKALEAALTASPNVETEIGDLVARLSKAATAEADARIQRLSAEARKAADALRDEMAALADEKDAIARALKEAEARTDTVRAELAAVVKEKQALAAAVKDANGKTDAARAELTALAKQKQSLALSLEDAQARLDESQEKMDALRGELNVLAKEKQALAAAIRQAEAKADALNADLEAHGREKDSLEAALNEAHALTDELQSELSNERYRAEFVRKELADARAAQQAAEAAQQAAEAARDEALASTEHEARGRAAADLEAAQVRAIAEAARAESAAARRHLDAALADRAALEESLQAAQSQAQAAETKLASVMTMLKASSTRVKTLERQQIDHETAMRDLEARLAAAAEAPAAGDTSERFVSQMEALLESFRALANASTVADVLTTLVEHLAAEFPRVALFHVKGNRLEGGHQIGFDFDNDIAKVVIPMSIDSLLTRAVSAGGIERLSGADLTDSSSSPFGGAPSHAVAMPVVVQEETLAILYADDSGQSAEERAEDGVELSARFAEALLQHAVALLTRMTTELRTLAELRAYAASLATEVEQMYAADVTAGRAGDDLQRRLKDNLDFARSLFETRIALESPDSGGLFYDQILTTIEGNAGTPFGQDLAAITGHAPSARAAEAS